VWIDGDDGPSHDFELVNAPRVGDRISIAVEGRVEEGIVATVSWHLQGIERAMGVLALEGEPIGSVTMVHIVCTPTAEVIQVDFEGAEMGLGEEATNH
jgi:hypothetical protein